MNIKKASDQHLSEVAALFDAYRVFYRKASDLEGATSFLTERLANKDSEIFVAEDPESGQLVGFVQLYPLFSSTRMARLWLLNDLYVSPKFRGQGISKLLIDRAKELARQTDAAGLMLETEKTNLIGNRLYPATGFEVDNDHHFYFWTNQ